MARALNWQRARTSVEQRQEKRKNEQIGNTKRIEASENAIDV